MLAIKTVCIYARRFRTWWNIRSCSSTTNENTWPPRWKDTRTCVENALLRFASRFRVLYEKTKIYWSLIIVNMQNYMLPLHDNDEGIKREFVKEKFLWLSFNILYFMLNIEFSRFHHETTIDNLTAFIFFVKSYFVILSYKQFLRNFMKRDRTIAHIFRIVREDLFSIKKKSWWWTKT